MSTRRAADDKKCLTIVIKPTCARRMLSGLRTAEQRMQANPLNSIVSSEIRATAGETLESSE